MKRFILLLLILYFASICTYAKEEDVYLDLNIPEIHKYDTGKVQFDNQKPSYYDDDEDYTKPSLLMIKKMYDDEFRPNKKPPKKK